MSEESKRDADRRDHEGGLLAEVRFHIQCAIRMREGAKRDGCKGEDMYWTGYLFAMRTVEGSIARRST
jgi:hypothetical protein